MSGVANRTLDAAVTAEVDAGRLGYLREVAEVLWPPPASVSIGTRDGRAAPRDSEFLLLSRGQGPRLLVPASRRGAASAALHHAEPASTAARIRARLLAGALRAGLGGALAGERLRVSVPDTGDTVETRLSRALGHDLRVSVYLGPPRANRKPVLQLLTPDGRTVGFAKVGVDAFTRNLVRAERAALQRLASAELRHVRAPRIVHDERWNGAEILVLSPLPVWRGRAPLDGARLAAAMGEVAHLRGVRRQRLTASPYWTGLHERLSGVGGEEGVRLAAALTTAARRAGGAELEFGTWHGDWSPWNMASVHGPLLVWDWERFGADAPLGFDALHYWLQARTRLRAGRPRRAAPRYEAARCVAHAPALLAPFGVPARAARLTALLYLADLAIRYLRDRQEDTGTPLGAAGSWLLPALASEVTRL